ncbi:DUF397 domain-containing protein [Streptosporangium sp. NBC_01810]|uniref:DUF397 domain-containing protein n=1 Tax=Streptosporangium sp. NBC_01810 TaxID=2975951 RepID=UPI002DDBE509|nr:DUF397 domain-containing protein [Streptosporangium sp. NBC_01810]WSA24385.1 DUF397 domain-containing protein [Streptosporangium sp. NBC_01810]
MDDVTRELGTAAWRKSSLSGDNGGNCVEIAKLSGGHRGIRDSKKPTGPALTLTSTQWTTFLHGVRNGEFD